MRYENEILTFKSALEKALMEKSEESTNDIIKALSDVKMSLELLKSTNIGSVLKNAKKQYNGSETGTKVKSLIAKWKKDCDSETSKEIKAEINKVSTSSDSNTEQSLIPKVKTEDVSNPPEDEMAQYVEANAKHLPPVRKKIMDLLVDNFKLNAPDSIAKFLGFSVESSINNLLPELSDSKAYMNKARSLTYNLKKNERLRQDVINGILHPDHLAKLTTNELATDELRGVREENAKEATMARRGDLYEITRSEILQANGIDPNKGGEFRCNKCKGTKTSHYSLQTRSSDEPMTVFVNCLTCGNRWRCT